MCFLWGFSPRFDWAGPCFTIEAEQGCRWSWPRSATFITFVKTDCKNSRKLDPSSALLPSYASGFPSTSTGTVHQRPVKHLPYPCCLHSGSKVSTYQHVSIAETILKNSLHSPQKYEANHTRPSTQAHWKKEKFKQTESLGSWAAKRIFGPWEHLIRPGPGLPSLSHHD